MSYVTLGSNHLRANYIFMLNSKIFIPFSLQLLSLENKRNNGKYLRNIIYINSIVVITNVG